MKINKVQFRCSDNVEIYGTLLEPKTETKAVIQINSATAVLKEFYLNFATYLVENNFAVLLYDYRGIGESKPKGGLKNCTYNYLDWGILDMTAALRFLRNKFPKHKIFIVGHSVGGQKVGLMPNHQEISGMFTFATSSGYWGSMNVFSRLKTHLFFEIIRPISNFIWGYSALKKIGLMEDLPKNIVNKWRDWCSVPEYFFDKKYYDEIASINYFKNLQFPIKVLYASDDYIVTDTNFNNFWKHIKSTGGIEIQKITPKEINEKEIGHFGFFRKKYKKSLWPIGTHSINAFLENDIYKKS